MTNLVAAEEHNVNNTDQGISSLMDTWLSLTNIELNGERNRGLYVLKSRGMNHSNQIREFLLTHDGIRLVDAYIRPGGRADRVGAGRAGRRRRRERPGSTRRTSTASAADHPARARRSSAGSPICRGRWRARTTTFPACSNRKPHGNRVWWPTGRP